MDKHKTAILRMFYGESGTYDNIGCVPEDFPLVDAVERSYGLLCEKLKPQPEILELFLKYKDGLEDLHISEIEKHYEEGFKFGLLIGVEAGESKFNN